jgi:glycosyltransferase involved in cell wall biosynthesis
VVRKAAEKVHVKYVGAVHTDEAIRLTAASDLVVAMMDPSNPNNVAGTPGKILNSMALARPYITNEGLNIGELTKRVGSGLVTVYDTNAFRETVLSARSSAGKMEDAGRKGRRHFEGHMSWSKSRDELLEAYDRLLGARG